MIAADNDEILVKQALRGNELAFRQIVENYKNLVYSICFSAIRNEHDAENAAQDTFLQVFLSLSTYEYHGFKSWISRIALRKAIDYKRKFKKEVLIDEDIEALSSQENDYIGTHLIKNDDRKRIVNFCNQLPEIYKSTINKFYILEKSYEEIALEDNVSIKTVESRLYRARKILKEKWEEDEK